MSYIDYSAFDPIFWLHHTMVDRCFAIWQVLNPGSYVSPQAAIYPTFTTSAGEIQDVTSPLTPFHKDVLGNFWTSENAQNTDTFRYAYPETVNPSGLTTSQMQAKVKSAINTLYGPSESAILKSPKSDNALKQIQNRTVAVSKREADTSTYQEWIVNLRVRKHALSAPFFVHILLGSFGSDPFSWSFEPNLVGTHCIYARAANTSIRSDHEVAGTIPLNPSLLERIDQGMLTSLNDDDVEPYLLVNLRYRITMLDDTEVLNDHVPDMKVTVVSSVVQKTASVDEFPVWREIIEHFNVDGRL